MEAKAQLQRLVRIQELAHSSREARLVVEGAPIKIAEIEARFRDRNAEYVAVKDHYDELEEDQKTRSQALGELEEQRDKYMESLMTVKNQREYAAMLKEIDTVKSEIAGHEEAILKDMEGIEKLKGELATHEEHIKLERERVGKERSEVEAESAEASKTIETLNAERLKIESELPPKQVRLVHKLEATRQGVFLSKAENGTCLSCFVRIRPQVFQEIKMATVVHTCDSCRRFLYVESLIAKPVSAESIAQAAAPEEAGPVDTPDPSENIEAVNGGAA